MAFTVTAATTASLLPMHWRQPHLVSLPSTQKPIVAKSTAHERWVACQSVGVKARFGSSKSGTGVLDRPAFDQSQLDPSTQVLQVAEFLRSTFVHLTPLSTTPSAAAFTASSTATTFRVPVHCGPRDNRGPLVKGRILSIEAIQAIQSLKRAYRQNPNNLTPQSSSSISRLLKPDLIAALRELLRQDYCTLALYVHSTYRSEFPESIPDLTLYSEIAAALARNGMVEEVDRLICELEKEEDKVLWGEDLGLVKLVKKVIGGERSESTAKIYWMMKRSGCGVQWEADEYLVKVLSGGLRRLGNEDLADQAQMEFGRVGGDIGRSKVRKGPGSEDSYRVLLVDDVHHTEKMVAKALPLAVPSVNPDDARKLFHASRENGVATVIITVKEHAEFYTQMMLRRGLRSRMEPDSNIA